MNALLADIGGTWARFAVLSGSQLSPIEAVATGEYANAIDGIRHYLNRRHNDGVDIDTAVIAAAGPVEGGRCRLTNASWVLRCDQLKQTFRLRSVNIVNDLEALAWAVPHFLEADVAGIGHGVELAGAPVVLVAPGTGLGMACFIPDRDGGRVLASEGGHATLAATDAAEARIIDFLGRRHGHVSAERVLSGRGLMSLYEVLSAEAGDGAPAASPEQIVREATDGSSETARSALDMFCAFLGSVAGSAALTFGARGGVLLAGGIAPRIVEALRRSSFREHFESKGRLRGYLAHIPTKVVTRRDPAFLGLMALANERQ
ncbi:MAG TPA: glucokinase [Reyranella sp.]